MLAANNLSDVANKPIALSNIGGVAKIGDTMTGPLVLPGNPTSPLQAAPKQYIDAQPVVHYDAAQSLTGAQAAQGRANLYGAPFDALAYNGMQVNGNMEVSQANGTNAVTASGSYVVDGWQIYNAGIQTFSAQQVTDAPPGYAASLKLSITAANASPAASDFCSILHPIEGYRVSRLAFGTPSVAPVSIGFWVKANRPGSYSASIRNGAGNRSYAFSFNVIASATWQYITATVPGDITGTWPNTNSAALQLTISIMSGTSYQTAANAWTAGNFLAVTGSINGAAATTDYMQITGVVILPGIELPSAARAPFIMRSFDQEFPLCSRYYSVNKDREPGFLNLGTGTTGLTLTFNHCALVPFRANPTVALVGTGLAIECPPWQLAATLTSITLNGGGHVGLLGGDYEIVGTSNTVVGAPNGSPAAVTAGSQIKFDARM
jgi:hypothetical protein